MGLSKNLSARKITLEGDLTTDVSQVGGELGFGTFCLVALVEITGPTKPRDRKSVTQYEQVRNAGRINLAQPAQGVLESTGNEQKVHQGTLRSSNPTFWRIRTLHGGFEQHEAKVEAGRTQIPK